MIYRFDAIDTFFFRSSLPFDIGAENSVECIFPPLPSVYTGALRSCTLKNYSDRHDLNKKLKVGLNGIMMNGEPLFPVPRDLNMKSESDRKFAYPSFEKNDISSYPLEFLYCESEMKKENIIPEGAYIKKVDLMRYLNVKNLNCEMISKEKLFKTEYRTGVQIENTERTAEDKKLYTITQIHPNDDVSVYAQTQGISVSDGTIVKFGGESKSAIINSMEDSLDMDIRLDDNEKFFKLYLATPAIFKNGWIPWWIKNDMTGIFKYKNKSVKIKLLCASIGRYTPVGGFGTYWDEKEKCLKSYPKKMHYAVPAGSVYYFSIEEGKPEDVLKLFHKKCISDYREHCPNGFKYENWGKLRYCDRGFGYSLVGKLTDEQKNDLEKK
ncbi:MAG: type III-B CRISPR module-associated protein Cmr3 [Clostridiales bacterium]|nr:type III-B CRISPR module-associated protein Cmr3 [Clostridiales bacterium]